MKVAGDQHLVVIRGNSASGKSTLANELQRLMGRGTANIGQDHFRRVVLREHDVLGGDNIDLISETARHCLRIGYHVILEGILFSGHYGDMLRDLIADHDGPHHVFYLDVPLDETLRRHANRPLGDKVEPDKLREWYLPGDLLGTAGEVVVDGGNTSTVQDLVAIIAGYVGHVASRLHGAAGRFL